MAKRQTPQHQNEVFLCVYNFASFCLICMLFKIRSLKIQENRCVSLKFIQISLNKFEKLSFIIHDSWRQGIGILCRHLCFRTSTI